MEREALFYRQEGDKVRCYLCPRECLITDGYPGACFVRKNVGGRLVTVNYGSCAAIALDPIEKKPFFHFHPGSQILSFGAVGCNFHCKFCQNWQISQQIVPAEEYQPEEAVALALKVPGNIGMAFTYNEPFIWYEFVYDCARLAHEVGLKTVMVTNGYVNEEPLEQLLPHIDAMNIDLKGMNSSFYARIVVGELEPVLETIKRCVGRTMVELTNLIVTSHNDELREIEELIDFVADISPDIPLHFSRYFPHFKLKEPPTPIEVLVEAWQMAREKLNYVYVGNVHVPGAEDTYCKGCGKAIIRRCGYSISEMNLDGERCGFCGERNLLVCQCHETSWREMIPACA